MEQDIILSNNGEEQLSKALNLSRYAKGKLNKLKGINVVSTELLKNDGAKVYR